MAVAGLVAAGVGFAVGAVDGDEAVGGVAGQGGCAEVGDTAVVVRAALAAFGWVDTAAGRDAAAADQAIAAVCVAFAPDDAPGAKAVAADFADVAVAVDHTIRSWHTGRHLVGAAASDQETHQETDSRSEFHDKPVGTT